MFTDKKIISNNLWDIFKVDNNKKSFTWTLIKYVMDNVKDAFGYCCRNKLSLKDYCPAERFGGNMNQATVFASVRLAEMWENGCYESLRNLFGMLEIDIDKIKRWTTSKGDFIIFNEIWELKTSQAKDSFTGATHSSTKCENLILINYKIDWNVKLDLVCSPQLIPEFSIFLLKIPTTDLPYAWMGVPTNKNSFTTLRIKNTWIDNKSIVAIWGDLKKTKYKFAKIIHFKNPMLEIKH